MALREIDGRLVQEAHARSPPGGRHVTKISRHTSPGDAGSDTPLAPLGRANFGILEAPPLSSAQLDA